MRSSTGLHRSASRRTSTVRACRARCLGGWLASVAVAAGISACTDAEVTTTSAFGDPNASGPLSGVFKPGNFAGLDFASGGETGVTDADGRFACMAGQPISFSIGAVELGQTLCETIVHPVMFSTDDSLMDAAAINITRFLLLLDEDQTLENGLSISAPLDALASTWPAVDFSATDFESELIRVVSDIASVENRATVSVPSATDAFAALDASLSCAYSGLFANTFAAGPFLARTDAAMIVYREPGSATDRFTIRIRRVHLQSQLFLGASGTVELRSHPLLVNGADTGTGRISAAYRTPDVVAGDWEGGLAQLASDRTGSFEVFRIGGAPGDYRFIGSYTQPNALGADTPVLPGFVSITMDGDAVTGEAFDMSGGFAFSVSGRRLPNSDQVEISTELTEDTAIVTLTRDGTGAIAGLDGTWPGIEGSSLSAVACRLN